MAKYINVDVALKLKDEDKYMWVYDLTDLEAFFADVPAADVEEVKRGEWIEDRKVCSSPWCSRCGTIGHKSSYCPHCGAKMKEVV